MNNYRALLAKANEMAKMYFEKGPDSVSYKELKGFEAVRELFYLARYEGNDAPDTITHFAEFVVKDMLQKLSQEKRLFDRSEYISFLSSSMDEAIDDATESNKPILIEKKNELLNVLKKAIKDFEDRNRKEFASRLAKADEVARQFLDKCSNSGNIESIKNDKDIQEYYLKALDITIPESKEDKEFNLRFSDYFLKKGLLIVNEIKKYNRPITSKEVKNFTDEMVFLMDEAIADNDKNKADYIKKKEEMIAIFNEELVKQKIEIKKGGCYIATAVYGSYDCPQVLILRSYRDNKLAKSILGRFFICTYYVVSPQIIKWFGKNAWFNRFGRRGLDKFVKNLRDKGYGEKL